MNQTIDIPHVRALCARATAFSDAAVVRELAALIPPMAEELERRRSAPRGRPRAPGRIARDVVLHLSVSEQGRLHKACGTTSRAAWIAAAVRAYAAAPCAELPPPPATAARLVWGTEASALDALDDATARAPIGPHVRAAILRALAPDRAPPGAPPRARSDLAAVRRLAAEGDGDAAAGAPVLAAAVLDLILELEQEHVGPQGRAPRVRRTDTGRLIAAAARALKLTRGQLAQRLELGVSGSSRLSRAAAPGGYPLPRAAMAELERIVADARKAASTG